MLQQNARPTRCRGIPLARTRDARCRASPHALRWTMRACNALANMGSSLARVLAWRSSDAMPRQRTACDDTQPLRSRITPQRRATPSRIDANAIVGCEPRHARAHRREGRCRCRASRRAGASSSRRHSHFFHARTGASAGEPLFMRVSGRQLGLPHAPRMERVDDCNVLRERVRAGCGWV